MRLKVGSVRHYPRFRFTDEDRYSPRSYQDSQTVSINSLVDQQRGVQIWLNAGINAGLAINWELLEIVTAKTVNIANYATGLTNDNLILVRLNATEPPEDNVYQTSNGLPVNFLYPWSTVPDLYVVYNFLP